MNKTELIMLSNYKREEMTKKLKPVLNWSEVKKGTEIFNKDSNSVHAFDKFEGLNPTNEDVIIYRDREGSQYEMSKLGWYFYDESIADEVKEMWTPKLYYVKDMHSEDYSFIVACNEDHLLKCWNEGKYDESKYESQESFMDNYEFYVIEKCDDFDIKVV